jgi:hypothetical protein
VQSEQSKGKQRIFNPTRKNFSSASDITTDTTDTNNVSSSSSSLFRKKRVGRNSINNGTVVSDITTDTNRNSNKRQRRRFLTQMMTMTTMTALFNNVVEDYARASSSSSSSSSSEQREQRENKYYAKEQLRLTMRELTRTIAELEEIITILRNAKDIGMTQTPSAVIKERYFENKQSAIYQFRTNGLKLDSFLDNEELTDIEKQVWETIPLENGGGVKMPFLVTPNEFVCALYSCVNSPDAPPSTDASLTLNMLQKGIEMGQRRDKRITNESLLLTAEDAKQKVINYLDIIEYSNKGFFNSLRIE